MPNFKYKVRDRSGKAIAGTLEAPNLEMAGERLYRLGYFPIVIQGEEKTDRSDLADLWQRFQKVTQEDLIFFSHQLSTLYRAGMPLLSGMKSLIEQTHKKKLKIILEDISRQVEGGKTLSEAMSRHPGVFPPVYMNMVRAGETTGLLGDALDRFITLSSREMRTRQRVKEATRYPKIIIVSLVIASMVLVALVIPRFVQIFAQFNTPLPWPTRLLIGAHESFQSYGLFLLLGSGAALLGLKRYLYSPSGKFVWDRWKTRIPLLGPLFLKISLSRFTYMFVMLNRSGIPILQTLEITSSTLNNSYLSRSIESISQLIREGRSLAQAMKETQKFTPLVIQMVAVGESSGTLDAMLSSITEYYDREIEDSIRRMSTYIEPILTLFLGGVVLFLALAVFLPWWNMASLFR
ncbi:MAG: type II secretion system F family protein [Syntrophaceae bacterium]|nr:type II secretion system F family protein [Syntrophaceae bacterium]